jgi:FixJ family two-component response regulator
VIAIIDDDDSVRRSLHRVVQSAGYAAESFGSAREFLDWLPRGRAACLVLDVHLSEMSGFDLQDRLAVPIIFITAHDDAATRERIEKSGASGHLRKPFGEKSILAAIRRAVRVDDDPLGERDGALDLATADPLPTDTEEERGHGLVAANDAPAGSVDQGAIRKPRDSE